MPRRTQARLYRFCDRFTEALIYFAVIFGPWAFGATQDWSIKVMNGVGLTLGLLWLVKLGLRCAKREAQSANACSGVCLGHTWIKIICLDCTGIGWRPIWWKRSL